MINNINKLSNLFYIISKYDIIKEAGKIEDLKSKYPNLDIEDIAANDPSDTKKYLHWMSKQLDKGHKKEDLYPTISAYHKNINRFPNKDINKYEDLKDLENIVKEILSEKSKTKQKQENKEGGYKIYEDKNYVVIRPDDKNSCISYGKNTKWCITMEDATYYEQYSRNNIIFYFIIRKQPLNDNYDKVALAYGRDKNNNIIGLEIFNSIDDQISKEDLLNVLGNNNILNIAEGDAKSRPKSILAKLKNKELTDDELKLHMLNKDSVVRKEVARTIDPSYLPQMINDESANVRFFVSRRIGIIDPSYLSQMINDKDAQVRYEVAKRIDPSYLPQMINDENEYVRSEVSKKIDPSYLPQMINDKDVSVLENVICRIDPSYLPKIFESLKNPPNYNYVITYNHIINLIVNRIDPSYLPKIFKTLKENLNKNTYHDYIIESIINKMNPEDLLPLINDEDDEIRLMIVKKISPQYLPQMLNDKNNRIRYIAEKRLAGRE